MTTTRQALKDLLARYRDVWCAAWDIRHQMTPAKRLSHELAFLPAHLELQDTPTHPAPTWAMRTILVLLVIALLWATLGKLDIVASANGKIIPDERVKVIQPLEAGTVRAIHVRDGQKVSVGQLLVELDAITANADFTKSEDARNNAALAAARAEALLLAAGKNKAIQLHPSVPLSEELIRREEQLARAQFAEYRSKESALSAELVRRRAELSTTREMVAKLEQTLPIVKNRAEEYRQLLDENFVSRHVYLDHEKERINLEKDLAGQRSRVTELNAAITVQEHQIQSLAAEFTRQQLDALNQAKQQRSQLTEDLAKAQQRQQLTRLSAPVAGTVQQLVIHTVGGVVTAAQQLLVIVPEDTLEVDATLENKDVGFVTAGQNATIKVETFPYTRYGYVYGQVVNVSNDAIVDENKGLVYRARIKLDTDRLWVDNKWVRLSPGMAVTAEIKTGRRRVIDYVLSPLTEHLSESFGER